MNPFLYDYAIIGGDLRQVYLTAELARTNHVCHYALCRPPEQVSPDTVILDIASSPGGVDFAAAKELSVTAAACPGLPGKYAPLSSAQAILACIKRIKTEFERS